MLDELDVNDLDQLRSRYDIRRELGRDGTFVLYRGRSLRSDQAVAIKLVSTPPSAGAAPGALAGWQAHGMKPLSHPCLLGLYAVHHLQGGALALAMEHGRYRTLAEVIRGAGPLPPGRAESVLRDVAGALSHLHSRGVVHRGVRPHSVFIDEDGGRALLAHFAIDLAPGERGDEAPRGALVRAFAYLAPEQIDGRSQVDGAAVSARSDLFSLGLVGYAMLTGRQPWEAEDLDGLLERRRREPLPALAALPDDVPEALRRAIQGALERRPGRRWKSAEAFLAALEGVGEPVRTAPARDWTAPLAALRGGAAVLGEALRGPRFVAPRGGRVLAVAGLVGGVAALGVLLSRPGGAGDHAIPAVTVVPRSLPQAPPPADASAPAPIALPVGSPPPARVVAATPRPQGRAAAAPAARPASSAASRGTSVPLLGDPVSPNRPGRRGEGLRSRTPPLLGTPVGPGGGGRR